MEEKFNKKVEMDREKVRKIVPQKFHKQLKVFEKTECHKLYSDISSPILQQFSQS